MNAEREVMSSERKREKEREREKERKRERKYPFTANSRRGQQGPLLPGNHAKNNVYELVPGFPGDRGKEAA